MVDILVADDDPEIIDLLRLDLELMGFRIDTVSDGLMAVKKAESKRYDLIIMDVMMPKLDGFEACKRIRSSRLSINTPIILLTAKGTIEDKIRGFNAGTDDYLVKPFEFQELMVRMRALLRRTGALSPQTTKQKQEILAAGDIQLLPTSLECDICETRIKLTPTEFEILYCLMQHVGEAVPLKVLLKEVWGYEEDEDVRMLRVHVGGLRQKVEADHKNPQYIQTVTNVGYRLIVNPDDMTTGSTSTGSENVRGEAIPH
jgi:two-component system, OmpR family, alkaline phosphatase synthesis response regulator PhoP